MKIHPGIPSFLLLAGFGLAKAAELNGHQVLGVNECDALVPKVEDVIKPYFEAIKSWMMNSSIKVSNFPQTDFPKKFSNFMNPGIGLIGEGSQGCVLGAYANFTVFCENLISKCNAALDRDKKSKEKIFKDIHLKEKGELRHDPVTKGVVAIGINPQRKVNYENALEFMKTTFLKQNFFDKSDGEILAFIVHLQAKLVHDLPLLHRSFLGKISVKSNNPGNFRRDEFILNHEKLPWDLERNLQHLRENCDASETELSHFTNGWTKAFKNKSIINFSEEEKAIWSHVAYLPAPVYEIDSLMREFIVSLKKLVKQNEHPVVIAAWAHQEIIRIRPFDDGNGRLARLLVNGILTRNGYPLVFCSNEEFYTNAVVLDFLKPGFFATFLTKELKWSQLYANSFLKEEGINFNL